MSNVVDLNKWRKVRSALASMTDEQAEQITGRDSMPILSRADSKARQVKAVQIAKLLNEPDSLKMVSISRLFTVEELGTLYARTMEVEANGGMKYKNGKQRRSPGGVFYRLANEALKDTTRNTSVVSRLIHNKYSNARCYYCDGLIRVGTLVVWTPGYGVAHHQEKRRCHHAPDDYLTDRLYDRGFRRPPPPQPRIYKAPKAVERAPRVPKAQSKARKYVERIKREREERRIK